MALVHAQLTDRILHAFYAVYNDLEHGFLEPVYEAAMAIALEQDSVAVERQAPVTVYFRGRAVGQFRTDLLVEQVVVVEIKAARTLETAHEAQLLNYLRATNLHVGLLLNFGDEPAFRRLVYTRPRHRNGAHLPSAAPHAGGGTGPG